MRLAGIKYGNMESVEKGEAMWFLEFCRQYREKLIERGFARKGCSARE